jgi:ATP-dependent Clp protease protease subunit
MIKDVTEELDKSPGDALRSNGMYVFMDEVNSETIKPVIEWILYENYVSVPRKKELLLMICSEGGDLSAAFALIDTMKSSQIPIKTVGLGLIASCGLLIFIAGTKGRRVLTPNTSILSHQFSAGSEGKAHDLFATVKEFELTQVRMINHYKECTGLSESMIKEKLLPAQDIWLDGEAALELNICDAISESNSKNESSKKSKKSKITLPK